MNSCVVAKIPKEVAEGFILPRHYSHRVSTCMAAFGLIEDGKLVGAVVYGLPSSPSIIKYAFRDRDFRLYELTRLVVETTNKNAASILIGRSLKLMDAPCAIISYADGGMHHCGIVYQATNWVYTGANYPHDSEYMVDGKRVHSTTLRSQGVTAPKGWAKIHNIDTVPPSLKYRYFYFVGNKKQKAYMMSKLQYDVVQDYPKCDQVRYDAESHAVTLFEG